MKTTKMLDAGLLARAGELTGIKNETALIHEALKALVERENIRKGNQAADRKPKGGSLKSDHFNEHMYETD
jgi:Arc/MetJ family transcription regulator